MVETRILQPNSDQWLGRVQKTIRDGLVMGARYSVVVSVKAQMESSGGKSTSSEEQVVGKYNTMLECCCDCTTFINQIKHHKCSKHAHCL